MNKTNKHRYKNKWHMSSFFGFLITLVFCAVVITITVINRSNVEELRMEQLIIEKSVKINEVISRLLYKTEALSALVLQSDGKVENFERVASTIADDPAILNVLIAPDGVVKEVYPLKGNDAVLGLNFYAEGAGNKEATMARKSEKLIFGGPFELIQGGQALVGRLPVFVDTEERKHSFWGLVSVTLKFPQALDGVGLATLEAQGFTYEIWRHNPDTNERQIIFKSTLNASEGARYIEKRVEILNAEWYIRVAPVKMWYSYSETWFLIASGLFISLLVAFVVQNNKDLKTMKTELEGVANRDYLTGVFNRRYFIEVGTKLIRKFLREKSECYVFLFDLDKFKDVNDTHGHFTGDLVLKMVASKVQDSMVADNIFARYGGEEFVMLVRCENKEEALAMAESLRESIYASSLENGDCKVTITASFGVSKVESEADFALAIDRADQAMFYAKRTGRNRVEFR